MPAQLTLIECSNQGPGVSRALPMWRLETNMVTARSARAAGAAAGRLGHRPDCEPSYLSNNVRLPVSGKPSRHRESVNACFRAFQRWPGGPARLGRPAAGDRGGSS
ncbi:hypothetical protein GCM10023195_30390 [Actinoallomurus liliacearum]|uniref:Uncharacterized protein n=1 Tax=Actinoallomurus liliacearum TaxID=1080073 RepID=A0ABP8TGS6_9ACTN